MGKRFDPSKVQTPGDQPDDDAETLPGADQGPTDPDDPVAIAEARERQVQATAMAEAAAAGKTADIAPSSVAPRKLKAGKHKRVMPNGDVVEVDINARPIDPMVEAYGPEVQAPKGTPVRKDGTPCQGNEQPYGVVGDIVTSQGRLVSRVIPYDSLQDKDTA